MASLGAQDSWLSRYPLAADIVAATGDRTSAGGIVAQAVREKLSSAGQAEPIAVLSRQLAVEWLPLMPGARFLLLDDRQADAHWKACGRLLLIHRVARTENDVTLTVGQGNRCTASGITARFSRTPSGWRRNEELSGGFVGGSSDCQCPADGR